MNVAPEVELGSPLEPTRVTKTDDALLMRGLVHKTTVSDIAMISEC
jgi:hypothetical protein